MVNLYLVRHGECTGNGSYIGRGSDVLLTDDGEEQVRSIQSIDCADYFYTSPMKRCLATSNILSEKLGTIATPITGLEEIDFGEWEGLTFAEITRSEATQYSKWIDNPIDIRPPGGESLKDLEQRVLESLPDFKKLILEDKIYNIVIVSHKGPLTILLLHMLKLGLDNFWTFKIDRGSVSKLNLYNNFSELEFLNKLN